MSNSNTRPVTLRDVAKKAGVSHSTVSRALKDSKLISQKTKDRIKDLAKSMGYSPDVVSSALSNYRKSSTTSPVKSTNIALIAGKHLLPHWNGFIPSAISQAKRFGYECDFYEWDPEIHHSEHSQRLKNQGVKGILLGAINDKTNLEGPLLNWNDFATITVGRFLASPSLDCITENSFQEMRMILEKCNERRFERPGLLTLSRLNIRTAFRIQSSFNSFWDLHPEREPVNELIIESPEENSQVMEWIEREKVDTIITYWFLINALVKSGLEFPPNLRIIALDLLKTQTFNHQFCGVIRDDEAMARTAISLLHDLIINSDFGIPETPKDILLESGWHEGELLIRNLY